MKFWFYAVILANVIFFLWEMQRESSRLTIAPQNTAEGSAKQILLLSELREQSVIADSGISAKDNEGKIVSSENVVASDEQGGEQVGTTAQVADNKQPTGDRGDLVQGRHEAMESAMLDSQPDSLVEQDSLSVAEEASEKGRTKSDEKGSVAVSTSKEEGTASQNDDVEERPASEGGQSAATNVEKTSIIAEAAQPAAELPSAADAVITERGQDEAADGGGEEALTVCYKIGPFGNKRQLNSWLDQQQIDRKRSEPIYSEQQIPYAYLVYYPAAETFAESKKNLAMLKEKGVNDLWLFRKGEMKGMVSLGLFREKFRAERLLNQLDDLDVAAEIQERYKNEQVLYVRIRQAISLEQPETLTVTDCAGSPQAGQ